MEIFRKIKLFLFDMDGMLHACGRNAGTLSVLVLSGETKEEMLLFSEVKPDLVMANVGEILPFLS